MAGKFNFSQRTACRCEPVDCSSREYIPAHKPGNVKFVRQSAGFCPRVSQPAGTPQSIKFGEKSVNFSSGVILAVNKPAHIKCSGEQAILSIRELGNLTGLHTLDLAHNELTALPESLGKL